MDSLKLQFGQAAIIPGIVEETLRQESQDPASVRQALSGFGQEGQSQALTGNLDL